MKKNLIIGLLFCLLILPRIAKSDEGMWLPMFIDRLNYVDMQKMGLKLTPEEIYSVNNSSLKDAIVHFGGGCTGELISEQGLILTNHHCGYGYIQSHSSMEHNYLADGFWAKNLKEELANEGLTVSFLVRMEDVTKKILAELNDNMTEKERNSKIDELISKMKKEYAEDGKYEVSIKSFFNGNEFYMFLYEVFSDVRLVGTPPESIGKFGGDTDNWMWPRHTGDFSLFRVYMSKDGKPAPYAETNVPYKPKHHLPISLNGVKQDDYAMIIGYPGTTDRFLTSYGVASALDLRNPAIIKLLDKKLTTIKADMSVNPEIKIKYASKYASGANFWKNKIGESKGLKRLKVYDKKKLIEKDFQTWANADVKRKEKYGNVLNDIENAYKELEKYTMLNFYISLGVSRGSEIISLTARFMPLYNELSKPQVDATKVNTIAKGIAEGLDDFFKNYNKSTDKNVFIGLMQMFYNDINPEQQPSFFKEIKGKYKSDISKYAEMVYGKSMFCDQLKLKAFLDKPCAKVLEKDPAFKIALSTKIKTEELRTAVAPLNDKMNKGIRLFVAGLREMQPTKVYYPDANSTMRITYGKVLSYYPEDAVFFDFFTTMKGIIEKEDPANPEFIVPKKLKELYYKKDFGVYGKDGVMNVAFLTNNDITGGNSGSPVINGKGELIGLAFDGNWEAMSGNIAFEPELQRTINVDIRYVLFIIDKFAGAENIIKELSFVGK